MHILGILIILFGIYMIINKKSLVLVDNKPKRLGFEDFVIIEDDHSSTKLKIDFINKKIVHTTIIYDYPFEHIKEEIYKIENNVFYSKTINEYRILENEKIYKIKNSVVQESDIIERGNKSKASLPEREIEILKESLGWKEIFSTEIISLLIEFEKNNE